jgi:hypothetical protein
MPARPLTALFVELRQLVEKQSHAAQSARSVAIDAQARTGEAISQSRDLMARVDALLGGPMVR